MENTKERKTVLALDMEAAFEPKSAFSPHGLKTKWRVAPYESLKGKGKLIMSQGGNPPDISYDPALTGWYKIYLYIPGSSKLAMKLSGDGAYMTVSSQYSRAFTLERLLWKCADMTGQKIMVTKSMDLSDRHTFLAGIEFEPMTEEEIAEWIYEETRTDTKRIYATDDMHNRLYYYDQKSYDDWKILVERFDHSDVEWLSVEQIRTFVTNNLPCDIDDFAFPRYGDELVQRSFSKFDYDRVLRETVEYGHKKGLKMSVSLRMGAWGASFPHDEFYFETDFIAEHPEWRTYDRNGDVVAAMSYAYPGVRKFMIDELINMARSGCEAVTLIAHRGIPYVLFEQPVLDRFAELYGEDARELPLDEPRLNKLHCEIMTTFFREAREALDKEFGKGKVEIHLRSLFSLYDTKYVGLDCEELAREGLVDAIISYPQRFYEKLDGDIWQEGKEWRIDLAKYDLDINTRCSGFTERIGDFDFKDPYVNYRGELCGPATKKEMIDEWMSLEKNYGVKIYIEIMPRHMSCDEFRRRALDLYALGAERIGLWDTYGRAPNRAMWWAAGRLGHKDELAEMDFSKYSSHIKVKFMGSTNRSRYNPSWGG